MAATDGPLMKKFDGKDSISSQEFLNIFNKFDKDGNGIIDKSELDNFVKEVIKQKVCKENNPETLKSIILDQYDSNKDGKISLAELAKILPVKGNYLLVIGKHQRLHVADFMKIWYHYDTDKSGYLETHELQGFLRDYLTRCSKLDEKITPQMIEKEAQTLMNVFDVNKDGRMELSELSKCLNVQDNFLTQFKDEKSQLKEEAFENIFNHYDQDGNGYIEDAELLGFLRDVLQNSTREPTTADLERYRSCILEICDSDHDGKLSKGELKLLLLSR